MTRVVPLAVTFTALVVSSAAHADYSKDVVGFLKTHCVSCHNDQSRKADLTLQPFQTEAAILKARKAFENVLRQIQSGEMPPPSKPRPTPAEVEAFVKALTTSFEKADQAAGPDPGRVTIRRLNRVEYSNTVRDLVGIDFDPAEDFPSDDIGHGFDNIGDVLSLSPVLMERYLAAAEAISERAIVSNPPAPPKRYLAAKYLEPGGPKVPQTRFRPITKGQLATGSFKPTQDGEYLVKTRVYCRPAGKDKARIALLANGEQLKTFEVTAPDEKSAQVFEAPVTLKAGNLRIAVELLNPLPETDLETRVLMVEHLGLEGPADTRPESHRRLLTVDPKLPRPQQTRQALTRLATAAFRRPATPDEVERLARLVEQTEASGANWEAGMRLALQAVLCSPKFLFRVELDDRPEAAEPHPINEYQLASRLSYFLWSTMPDQELFDLAGKKQLTPHLEAQVRRMLADPKADALVENFATQWLQLRRLSLVAPDPKLFPNFNDRLREDMLEETKRFVAAVIRENRSVLDLIDADFTFLNERLARHYGIADTAGNKIGDKKPPRKGQPIRGEQFVRVNLAGGERGGLLTQASILTVTSNPTRTSPVKRGKWVLEQVLGTPPPPPPPDVPELDQKGELTGTLRQRMEQHRANVACANCHARMDPIGFAFENFDAVGAFRERDAGQPIDPSGVLPDGKTFRGPADLKAILKGKSELFTRCLTEKLLTYALGRGLEYTDKPTLDKIQTALAADGHRFSTLVIAIVQSDPFRLRRGKDQSQ